MEREEGSTPEGNERRAKAIAWLRETLLAVLHMTLLSLRNREATARLIQRLPDWTLDAWARALGIDYEGLSQAEPNFASNSDRGGAMLIAERYLDAHGAVPAANALRLAARSVRRLWRVGWLVVDREVAARQICALALSGFTPDGQLFAAQAAEVLGCDPETAKLLRCYNSTLWSRQANTLEQLDAVLSANPYGQWLDSRLDEAMRWLGLDTPDFRVQSGERTPQWDILWGDVIKGGRIDS